MTTWEGSQTEKKLEERESFFSVVVDLPRRRSDDQVRVGGLWTMALALIYIRKSVVRYEQDRASPQSDLPTMRWPNGQV